MLRVLIADDEAEARNNMVEIIDWESCGIEIAGMAGAGAAAYEMINRLRPDIVILDIEMPGMTGIEVIERVTAEKQILPAFIIMSGYDDFEYARQALRLSVVEYLLKPFLPAEIVGAIHRSVRYLEAVRVLALPDCPEEPKSPGDALGGNFNLSAMWYPAREEARLVQALKAGGLDGALDHIQRFWSAADEHNDGEPRRLFHCALMLYSEICRLLVERGCVLPTAAFQTPRRRDESAGEALAREITRIVTEAHGLLDQNRDAHMYVKNAMDYIDAHYSENLTLELVAGKTGISPSYLSGAFTRASGVCFVDYIQSVRVGKAKELLRATSLKTYEVAYQVGYEDAKYFSQVFKKVEGITPTDFRGQSDIRFQAADPSVP